jgi:hypothetical protein
VKGLHKVLLQASETHGKLQTPLAKTLYQHHKHEVVFKNKKGQISMEDKEC